MLPKIEVTCYCGTKTGPVEVMRPEITVDIMCTNCGTIYSLHGYAQ